MSQEEYDAATADPSQEAYDAAIADSYINESRGQMIAVMLIPRITGTITLVASLYMFSMAWKRRDRLFHRLVLGISIHLSIFSAFMIYGTAAIPEDKDGVDGEIGYYGTVETCTVQGFFINTSNLSSLFYYAFYAVYSYVGVTNNFETAKYLWIEKYIHVLVHLVPLGSSLTLLWMEAFNDTLAGFCQASSAPQFCGLPEYGNIECQRGPGLDGYANYRLLLLVPYLMVPLIPTAVMIALYFNVRKNQSKIRIPAKSVANQMAIYLFVIYWTTFPFIATESLIMRARNQGVKFALNRMLIFALINVQLFGLYSMLVYRYFVVEKKHIKPSPENRPTEATTGDSDGEERKESPSSKKMKREDSRNDEIIFGTQEFKRESQASRRSSSGMSASKMSASNGSASYTFNIFDGTNAGGAYADFIFEGDEKDEENNKDETDYWNGCQDINS